jgi:RimJ/RimL family protein N-acetyltransferase
VPVVLQPITASQAKAVLAGDLPDGVRFAQGFPTEFSMGVAGQVGAGAPLGPFFIRRAEDGVVVGEIGAALVEDDTLEIGYAIVESCWGRGHATDAVRALLGLAREVAGVKRVIAHTPFDRPASSRVLAKAGFASTGEVEDEHEGEILRVCRWEFGLL